MRTRRKGNLVVAFTRLLTVVGLMTSLVVVTEARLQAYLDPGSGLMFWQTVMAGALGAVYFARRLIRRMTFWKRPIQSPGREEHKPTSRE